MFLSVRHKPMQKEAINSFVINTETGEKIPRVIWANDETGRYRQRLVDDSGKLLLSDNRDRIQSKIFTGNIKIVKKDDFERAD